MNDVTRSDEPKPSERSRSAARFFFGAMLLCFGALLLADNLGLDVPIRLWNFWPLVVIGLGLVKLLWPGDRDDRSGGFWTLIAGLYCAISVWRLFGLHWGTAWPIFLVATGLQIVFEGAFGKMTAGRSDRAN